ncbi:uncharacterized protein PFL1_01777 [Pseudozyma flocculosa PF-1]|uniref:uncharacterized protein n=1 Tax=Pseudozyma flocculosa PF-1 TaxID=1277687 RepID=UPI00045617E0|nr:uncharacterized protein PFL1_01777 [Pseudozyma flocculosa PF-1]EPQ30880.1 hypothetical protein PFL1_01777 [Pseudozyma flocculosa PF-1]
MTVTTDPTCLHGFRVVINHELLLHSRAQVIITIPVTIDKLSSTADFDVLYFAHKALGLPCGLELYHPELYSTVGMRKREREVGIVWNVHFAIANVVEQDSDRYGTVLPYWDRRTVLDTLRAQKLDDDCFVQLPWLKSRQPWNSSTWILRSIVHRMEKAINKPEMEMVSAKFEEDLVSATAAWRDRLKSC